MISYKLSLQFQKPNRLRNRFAEPPSHDVNLSKIRLTKPSRNRQPTQIGTRRIEPSHLTLFLRADPELGGVVHHQPPGWPVKLNTLIKVLGICRKTTTTDSLSVAAR